MYFISFEVNVGSKNREKSVKIVKIRRQIGINVYITRSFFSLIPNKKKLSIIIGKKYKKKIVSRPPLEAATNVIIFKNNIRKFETNL